LIWGSEFNGNTATHVFEVGEREPVTSIKNQPHSRQTSDRIYDPHVYRVETPMFSNPYRIGLKQNLNPKSERCDGRIEL